ncbi:hypothetical protein HU200_003606 [Digitaria exilis]|uniref:Uncharacterized protein n=1 Tax=Digitaria exilis TaxID=1010633 RepID=A0A835FWD7_9POAL|nr:hypothetical protein HU200_003606 [Digitaria exilis]
MFSGMVKPGEVLERSGVEGIKLAVDSSSRKPERSDVAGTEQVELARDHEDSEVESSRVDFHRRRASASAWPWQGGLPDRAVLKHSMPRSGHLLDESHCASLMSPSSLHSPDWHRPLLVLRRPPLRLPQPRHRQRHQLTFDLGYYLSQLKHRCLLQSDAALLIDPVARADPFQLN